MNAGQEEPGLDGAIPPEEPKGDSGAAAEGLQRREAMVGLASHALSALAIATGAAGAVTRGARAAGDVIVTGLAPASPPSGSVPLPDPSDPPAIAAVPDPAPLWPTAAPQPAPVAVPAPGAVPAPAPVPAEVAAILSTTLQVTLAANRPGRSPQVALLPMAWDGDVVLVCAARWSASVRHLAEDPRVTLCAVDAGLGQLAIVSGTASIRFDEAAAEQARLMAARSSRPDLAGDEVALITVTPAMSLSGPA